MPDRRTIPACPPMPAPAKALAPELFTVHVVTPMFGGSATAGEVDAAAPVRAASVRGHLRFWWRATRGAAFATGPEMRKREAAIWGSAADEKTGGPSRVWARVTGFKLNGVQARPVARWAPKPNGPGFRLEWDGPFAQDHRRDRRPLPPLPYVAFPFQGESPTKAGAKPPAKYLLAGWSFDLELAFPPELRDDVEAAVWAWVAFGGVGARTRRGCGALYCQRVSPAGSVALWFRDRVKKHGLTPRADRAWPTLGRDVSVRDRAEPALTAWQYLVDEYRDVRQGVGFGRAEGTNSPGRSHWPEPETIRRHARQRLGGHPRLGHVPDDAVPRAGLGLPIVTPFHPQQKGDRPTSDPRDTMFVPVLTDRDGSARVGDRWASPLVLKPLAVSSTTAYPLVFVLGGPRVQSVALVEGRGGKTEIARFGPGSVRGARLAGYQDSPLSGAPQTGDAVDAVFDQFTASSYGCKVRLA